MPDPRTHADEAQMSAAFARAIDLSPLQARGRPASPGQPNGESAGAPAGANRPDGAAQSVLDVTDDTFEQVLQLTAKIPVVVDLWAEWCQPCRQLSPILERLADEGNGTWILAKVDVDANPGIAQAFQAQSIPMVVAVAGGKPVAAFQGAQPEPQVREWITSLIDQLRETLPGIKEAEDAAAATAEPEPEDPRLTAAEDATARGDHAAAASAYRQILTDQPDHGQALSGLAWAELFCRVDEAPDDVLDRSVADPANVTLAMDAADVLVSTGQATAGFEALIAAVRRTAGDDRTRLREHLLALFTLFAPDDADVIKARKVLTAALF